IAVAPSYDTYVQRFLAAVGLVSLLQEARFADNAARMANRSDLNAHIDTRTRTKTVAHWFEAINQAGCPCGRVMELDEMVNDPQVLAQQMIIESTRDGRVPIKMTGFPVKLSLTPCELRGVDV
ncbi:MAG: CoA transferase, partial [Proteobacteria bacterium]|nr:CoA transferase [Pseudomonadota bacterium]